MAHNKLCKICYCPGENNNNIIKDIEAHIIFAAFGEEIPLYEDPEDNNALRFYGTEEQEKRIQEVVQRHVSLIIEKQRQTAADHLNRHVLFSKRLKQVI